MSSGRIIQIIGAVIDVEFERNSVPKIYDALQVDGTETTLEVQHKKGLDGESANALQSLQDLLHQLGGPKRP